MVSDFTVSAAGPDQIPEISALAYAIWPETYHFLPEGQVPYMLEKMYAPEALLHQMQNQHQQFLLLRKEAEALGFASYTYNADSKTAKLNKLYVLLACHGKGLGKLLLQETEQRVAKLGANTLFLNVNRHNPAFAFYQNMGFAVAREEDIPIGPYFMNDYLMQKSLFTAANRP